MGMPRRRIRPAVVPTDPDAEATLVDPRQIAPSLRALVAEEVEAADLAAQLQSSARAPVALDRDGRTPREPETRRARPTALPVANDRTRIGELVPGMASTPPSVLMTAHLPSDLDFSDLIDEDAADERPANDVDPLTDPARRAAPAVPHRPAVPARAETPAPASSGPSHDWLVRPISMSAIRAVSDCGGVRAVDPAEYPSSWSIDGDEPWDDADLTRTFCRLPAGEHDDATPNPDTSGALPGFVSAEPAPRRRATARGMGPQRYIPTLVGQNPSRPDQATYDVTRAAISRRPPMFTVALLGLAAIAVAVATQIM